jgi:hypothetical protein
MTKPLDGIRPIDMGETLYRLISRILCFQFRDAFGTHFPYTNLKLQQKKTIML